MAGVRKRAGRWIELPAVIVLAGAVAVLINTFVAQAFYIPSASMVPQLRVNDRVVVSKLAYHLHAPRRGDVVVFSAPASEQQLSTDAANPFTRLLRRLGRALGVSGSKTELIKRVVALPGETVAGRDGQVYVNGERLVEPYLVPGTVTSDFGPVDVPPGRVWVMGDNRTNSSDSRVFGPIPVSTIVGRAVWRVWPVPHASFL
ncbi:MAG TPA: signal peptidase I [Acidimicrobiales bacterium]|jgi:signal peptidase I|nr:signal peptidase I [Acidimicrobiales bacterium]